MNNIGTKEGARRSGILQLFGILIIVTILSIDFWWLRIQKSWSGTTILFLFFLTVFVFLAGLALIFKRKETTTAADIELNSIDNNQQRIDYIRMILEKDSERLGLIDSHRNKNLAHALITFAAAFGGALKFLPRANPYLVSTSLFFLALCFFLRDCQLHRYEHGWNGTIKEHLKKLAYIINHPTDKVDFYSYYCTEEKKAFRCREWLSFNRWVYYLLGVAAISAGIILANGWVQQSP